MSKRELTPSDQSTRRDFFETKTAVAKGSLLSGCGKEPVPAKPEASATPAPAVLPLTREARDAMTPDQVLGIAREGNLRFRQGRMIERDFLTEQRMTASGQHPAAAVLGCIDSRGPAEVIFNLGLGDAFNCRVAGNILNSDILGSLEFATKLSGAKLVLVLGHSACGAVKGALSGAELGSLTQLLAKIRPAIEATAYSGDRTVSNDAFVDAVARTNVAMTISRIRKESPVIAELERSGALKIAGGFHDVATGAVDFIA